MSEEIKVIDLHNEPIDEGLLMATQNDLNTNEDSFDSETNSDKEQNNNSVDQVLATDEVITSEIINEDSEESLFNNEIVSLSDYWEQGEKEEIIFLFENLISTKSSVLNNSLINFLKLNSKQPQNFNQIDFNNLKIVNLIKLGERESAFNMINSLNQIDNLLEGVRTVIKEL